MPASNSPPESPLDRICIAVRSQVVFPRSVATLEVSRPENLRALELHGSSSEPLIAVPLLTPDALVAPETMHRVGTACRLLDSLELPDGSRRIVLQGLHRVVLASVGSQAGAVGALAIQPSAPEPTSAELAPDIATAIELVRELVSCDGRYSDELARVIALNAGNSSEFADLVASKLLLPYEEQARLLVELDLGQRLLLLHELLRAELARADLTRGLHRKVDERVRQGFLREQLEVIRSELGMTDPIQTEALRFEQRIEDSLLSESRQQALLREVERFRRVSLGSPEASRIRNYLDWVLELPWGISSPDPEELDADFSQVTEVIERTHTGLVDVKNRVCEFLAVRHLGGAARGTVLCFAGPPGTGKSSMSRAIAQALGREFVHISVGGLADETDLRGQHHSQRDAVPGALLQGLHRARTQNPVVLLDEIDRMQFSSTGEAGGVLTEILDREQNREFLDHYLDLPFDLSQCIFIVTANDLDEISEAILDRLEVIEFGSYSESDKLAIAREHLIPLVRRNSGLDKYQFKVTPGALRSIVRNYTEEAGVRQLQRLLSSLSRKAAVQVLRTGLGMQVYKSRLLELLGPANVDEDIHFGKPRVGVSAGLAWTGAGGSMLPIEALAMPGSGNSVLTGSVGDVMRESVATAMSWVRTRLSDFGLEHDILSHADLHLHFPASATPKDGPSAGLAIATALVSLLTEAPVRHDVAMTGEMSLLGAVLPVGGLREKLLAAARAGIRTVIVPARNSEEVLRLPAEVRQQLDIQPVDHITQCLAIALKPKPGSCLRAVFKEAPRPERIPRRARRVGPKRRKSG